MTDERNEMRALAGFARRQWGIVTVAVLVGAIAAGAWGVLHATEPGYSASLRISIATAVGGVQNAPTVDSVIAAASSPDVLASVADTLGTDPAGIGTVSTAIDGKNTSVVVVTVHASNAALAERSVTAVAKAARDRVLALVEPSIAYQRAQLAAQERHIPELRAQLAALSKLVSSGGLAPIDRVAIIGTNVSVEGQLMIAEDRLAQARLALAQIDRYALVEGVPTAVKGSKAGATVSDVLRGVLLGLMAGLAVAIVRERLRRKA